MWPYFCWFLDHFQGPVFKSTPGLFHDFGRRGQTSSAEKRSFLDYAQTQVWTGFDNVPTRGWKRWSIFNWFIVTFGEAPLKTESGLKTPNRSRLTPAGRFGVFPHFCCFCHFCQKTGRLFSWKSRIFSLYGLLANRLFLLMLLVFCDFSLFLRFVIWGWYSIAVEK